MIYITLLKFFIHFSTQVFDFSFFNILIWMSYLMIIILLGRPGCTRISFSTEQNKVKNLKQIAIMSTRLLRISLTSVGGS